MCQTFLDPVGIDQCSKRAHRNKHFGVKTFWYDPSRPIFSGSFVVCVVLDTLQVEIKMYLMCGKKLQLIGIHVFVLPSRQLSCFWSKDEPLMIWGVGARAKAGKTKFTALPSGKSHRPVGQEKKLNMNSLPEAPPDH